MLYKDLFVTHQVLVRGRRADWPTRVSKFGLGDQVDGVTVPEAALLASVIPPDQGIKPKQ